MFRWERCMIIKSHSGGQGVCVRLYTAHRGQVLGGMDCYSDYEDVAAEGFQHTFTMMSCTKLDIMAGHLLSNNIMGG